MDQSDDQPKTDRRRYAINLFLVSVAGQAGCLTVLIILIALFGGLWLDNRFQTRPVATIILMVASVPITLLAMLWLVRVTTSRIRPVSEGRVEKAQEDAESG